MHLASLNSALSHDTEAPLAEEMYSLFLVDFDSVSFEIAQSQTVECRYISFLRRQTQKTNSFKAVFVETVSMQAPEGLFEQQVVADGEATFCRHCSEIGRR